jgi:hypothetical protein
VRSRGPPGKKCHDEDASIHRDFFSVASDFFPPRGDLTFRLEPIETELFSGPHLIKAPGATLPLRPTENGFEVKPKEPVEWREHWRVSCRTESIFMERHSAESN